MNLQAILHEVNAKIALKRRIIKGVDVLGICILFAMFIFLCHRFQNKHYVAMC